MTLIQAILLGIIQGATEFIPVSSSGHLVITPFLLGWSIDPQEAFVFDVLVQVATLSAVIVFFWDDLFQILRSWFRGLISGSPFKESSSRMGWYLILATIPAGVAAVLFKETFERAFSDPEASAWFLIGTGVMLWGAEQFRKRTASLPDIDWLDAIWVGLFQILALFPGISRSGSTITGGMFRGLNRRSAAKFSFLMSVPVMLAAGVLAVYDLLQIDNYFSRLPIYLSGFLAAGVVGYLAIRWLLGYLSSKPLTLFSLYCISAGITTLLLIYY